MQMTILQTSGWDNYELLDSGNGYRLERFGKYQIAKPDPQAIWLPRLPKSDWGEADAIFEKKDGKEGWIKKGEIPEKWEVTYKDIKFFAKLAPFKHTGIFPEQHLNWDFISEKISSRKESVAVLNLFGYTGIASLVAAAFGAKVTHVDASKSSIAWARDNQMASHLEDRPIRWILDDAVKFVAREIRRGNHYEGIIMDPPIYGHGPHGELWDFSKSFPELVKLCSELLSSKSLFFLINAYAISSSAIMLHNVLRDYLPNGNIEVGELAIKEKNNSERMLSTGIFARWTL
ncbi:MAG: class I SAM-dependent methyltransferase [Candidatus Levybacteria bacterium]|nr:class I SAM-dependent methyltransferase [Candidatus Levybacteria bacterium]